MIKLWGRANSSNVIKVILTLEELGLPYERLDVGGPFGGTDTAAYRAMNPLGLVPSLEDGPLALFESNAIARYLCNAYAPDSTLYPQAPARRAVVEAWMEFQQTAQNRPMSVVFQGLVRTPPEQRDTAAIATAVTDVAKIWNILDGRLATQEWLAGNHLTLADIAFAPHIHRWLNLPIPNRPNAPNLQTWYTRLLTRPSYTRHGAIPIT